MPVSGGVYLIVGTHCRTSPYVQLSPGIPAVWIVTWVDVQGLTTTTASLPEVSLTHGDILRKHYKALHTHYKNIVKNITKTLQVGGLQY